MTGKGLHTAVPWREESISSRGKGGGGEVPAITAKGGSFACVEEGHKTD